MESLINTTVRKWTNMSGMTYNHYIGLSWHRDLYERRNKLLKKATWEVKTFTCFPARHLCSLCVGTVAWEQVYGCHTPLSQPQLCCSEHVSQGNTHSPERYNGTFHILISESTRTLDIATFHGCSVILVAFAFQNCLCFTIGIFWHFGIFIQITN